MDYIKELQSKVKALEDVIETPVESVVLVRKPPLMNMDENSMFSIGSPSRSQQISLKIEVKLNGKSVMIKVQCKNQKGLVVKALSEIEKLPMTITTTNIMPFGDSSLDIVIMAEVSCLISSQRIYSFYYDQNVLINAFAFMKGDIVFKYKLCCMYIGRIN